jgi:type II secretory pathway component PulM
MLNKNPQKEVPIKASADKQSLLGLLFILVAVGLFLFLIRPLGEDVDRVQADITAKSAKLTAVQAQVDALALAEEKYKVTTEPLRIESLKEVPTSMQQDEVIRDLVNIAANNGIVLRSVSFGRGAGVQDGVSSLRISSSFEGSYQDLIKFLEAIEENGRLFKVDTISVQIQDLGFAGIERATFSLTILTYFQDGV